MCWKENGKRIVLRKNYKIIHLLFHHSTFNNNGNSLSLIQSFHSSIISTKRKTQIFFYFLTFLSFHYFYPPFLKIKIKPFFFLPTKTSKLSNIIIIIISVKLKKKCFFSRNMQLYKFNDVFKERKQSAYYP